MATKVQAKLPVIEDIDRMVVARIRKVFDQNEEMKLLRKGLMNPKDPDFIEYIDYVEKQRQWGKEQKRAFGLGQSVSTPLEVKIEAVKRKSVDWLAAFLGSKKVNQKEG